ncbi:membrane protein [Clostridia bacterium]|nr:membrane protein [Clostridia bacterium]
MGNKKTSIGGQALIEGIMMRGPEKAALAVREKTGGIYLEDWDIVNNKWYRKTPFIRGVFNFVSQMADGYKYIGISMEKSGLYDEDEETSEPESAETPQIPEKHEQTPEQKAKNESRESAFMAVITVIGGIAGVGIAVLLFMFLPTWIFSWIQKAAGGAEVSGLTPLRSLFEGLIKLIVFVGYMALTALMKDIRRTYEYHGAEHKTIACHEAGEELTCGNVRTKTRFHPRCGTSFIFLSLAISIVIYSIFPINSELFVETFGITQFAADFLRVVIKLILLPLIVSVSYEVIRLAGRHEKNPVMRVISAPGLLMQRLTTREPDDSMIEVAIAAMKKVIPEDKSLDVY